MQHYMHYGLGFQGDLLSEEDYQYLLDNEFYANKNKIELKFKSYTEHCEGKEWGVVILKNFGSIGDAGKYVSYNDLKKIMSKEAIIDIPTRNSILEVLKKAGFENYIDNVELIVFTSMC